VLDKGTPVREAISPSAITSHTMVSCRHINKRVIAIFDYSFWWAGVLDKGTYVSEALLPVAITSHTMVSCRHSKRVVGFLEYSFL
jgi:hypothetical protein